MIIILKNCCVHIVYTMDYHCIEFCLPLILYRENLHERHHHHQQTSPISATKHTSNHGNFLCFTGKLAWATQSSDSSSADLPDIPHKNTAVTEVTSYVLQGNLHERHNHHQQTSPISATKHTSNHGNFLCFTGKLAWATQTIISRRPQYPLQNTVVTMVTSYVLQGNLHERHHHHQQTSPISRHKTHQ